MSFEFTHDQRDTGGRKYPTEVTLRAHRPDTGEVAGTLHYYSPKRKGSPVTVKGFEGDRHPGAGSALLNEMERRHPGSRTQFLDELDEKSKPKPGDPDFNPNRDYGLPTDWDTHYPKLPGSIHRGLGIRMDPSEAAKINTGDRPSAEQAKLLYEHVEGRPIGMHWSADPNKPHNFAFRNALDPRTDIPVVLHADIPPRKDIETRPEVLRNKGVWPHDHSAGDVEVPIRKRRPVTLRGISWLPDAEHPEADENGWVHHTFAEPMQHYAAGTNWDRVHPTLPPTVHRGAGLLLSPEDHRYVHDPSVPAQDRAHHLIGLMADKSYTGGIGKHWTTDPWVAHDFAGRGIGRSFDVNEEPSHEWGTDWEGEPRFRPGTYVMLHADTPAREDLDEGHHDVWGRGIDYETHPEKETPLHAGRPVRVTGISWGHEHDPTHRWPDYQARYPDEPEETLGDMDQDEGDDRPPQAHYPHHHTFAHPVRHTAADGGEWWQGKDIFGNPVDHRAQGTDWDKVHPTLPETMHRGVGMLLSPEDHRYVHDHTVPAETRGRWLLDHMKDKSYTGGIGRHWTTSSGVAHDFAMKEASAASTAALGEQAPDEEWGVDPSGLPHGQPGTAVILHARTPSKDDISRRHSDVFGVPLDYRTHPEKEVPLRRGRPVEITGLSWGHEFNTGHDPHDPDKPLWELSPAEHDEPHAHYPHQVQFSGPVQHIAVHPMPSARIFGPTYGLDHRLFTGDHLKPEVREAVMGRLDRVLRIDHQFVGIDWQDYIEVYLAGSEASEWTSIALEGNDDFDTLLGIDYAELRARDAKGPGAHWVDRTDAEIDDEFNALLRQHYNDENWHAPFGGVWHLTGYVNADAYDIRDIKPYAAYDLNKDEWAVRPPHLPSWGPESFPEGPALWRQAEAVADEIEAIDELPEPYRTTQGAALYDFLHELRHKEFTQTGHGWYGPGNVIEKYLDQLGLWAVLVLLKHNEQHGSFDDGEQRLAPALAAIKPPEVLYHGTLPEKADIIEREGIIPQRDPGTGRVFLSEDPEDARAWARVNTNGGFGRDFEPVVFEVHHPNVEHHRLNSWVTSETIPAQHIRRMGSCDDQRGVFALASKAPFFHGGPNRVEVGDFIHQDAMPEGHGRLTHNFFTTDREVAEDAADMRNGKGHGWIHVVEPTGPYEVDYGEPESWKSRDPLRVVSVEPGRHNGSTPHPPILRQQGVVRTKEAAYSFDYARNTGGAPKMPGGMYGQDIEPHGRYMTVKDPRGNYDDERWETGRVTFANPLHLPYDGWKQRLSEMHGGRTGRALSQAVVDAGYDGIVTHDETRGVSHPAEIVDLRDFKKTAVLPGGDVSPMGSKVEWVRTEKLLPHREFHVDNPRPYPGRDDLQIIRDSQGHEFLDKHSPQSFAENARSVAEEGIREPIHLQYDPKLRTAYIGEGNHRLEWARQAGHEAVPVTVHRTSYGYEHPTFKVPGEPKVKPNEHGYVSGDLRPSDVLPEDYLWRPSKIAGARGDLPEGLTFTHREHGRGPEAEHTLIAHHPDLPFNGGHEGHAGHMSWWDDTGEVSYIEVYPPWRRRGIATEMWRRAKEITPHLQHVSDEQTDEGRAWARTTVLKKAEYGHWITREHTYRPPGELEEDDIAPPYIQESIDLRNKRFDREWRDLSPVERERVHHSLRQLAGQKMIVGTNAAHEILSNGRMKTLAEGASRPTLMDPHDYAFDRRALEHHLMGVPENENEEHQPIYGSLHDDPSENVYGRHQLELKPHVRVRTGVTMGDSLNKTLRGYHIDHVPHLSHDELRAMTDPDELVNLARGEKPKSYMEMQVHGGVGLHDIAAVHVHESEEGLTEDDHKVMAKAREIGVPVVHHKSDPDHGLTGEQVATLRGHG